MTATASENTYDQVPYPHWTHRDTHPRQLEAIATLFGMHPAPITGCRVLEIGCAAGWNLIPMAEDLPGSEFVGLDSSTSQIGAARALPPPSDSILLASPRGDKPKNSSFFLFFR